MYHFSTGLTETTGNEEMERNQSLIWDDQLECEESTKYVQKIKQCGPECNDDTLTHRICSFYVNICQNLWKFSVNSPKRLSLRIRTESRLKLFEALSIKNSSWHGKLGETLKIFWVNTARHKVCTVVIIFISSRLMTYEEFNTFKAELFVYQDVNSTNTQF